MVGVAGASAGPPPLPAGAVQPSGSSLDLPDAAPRRAGRAGPPPPPPLVCPSCGADALADALFCEDCGYDFTTGSHAAATG